MVEKINEVLSTICPTYQHHAPEDSKENPVIIFEIFSEEYGTMQDDVGTNEETVVTVKLYSNEDDDNLRDLVEATLKGAFSFCFRESKNRTKESGQFLTIYEFRIHEI